MTFKIRLFEPKDAQALATLFYRSVHEAAIKDYSLEQVQAWSPVKPDPERYIRLASSRTIFVAEDDHNNIIGYGELELNGHIDHLYCHPDKTGNGVGSAIYNAIEAMAIKHGINSLFVEASEGARPLFEKYGFSIKCRNDFKINGVMIHNYTMEKTLGSEPVQCA